MYKLKKYVDFIQENIRIEVCQLAIHNRLNKTSHISQAVF